MSGRPRTYRVHHGNNNTTTHSTATARRAARSRSRSYSRNHAPLLREIPDQRVTCTSCPDTDFQSDFEYFKEALDKLHINYFLFVKKYIKKWLEEDWRHPEQAGRVLEGESFLGETPEFLQYDSDWFTPNRHTAPIFYQVEVLDKLKTITREVRERINQLPRVEHLSGYKKVDFKAPNFVYKRIFHYWTARRAPYKEVIDSFIIPWCYCIGSFVGTPTLPITAGRLISFCDFLSVVLQGHPDEYYDLEDEEANPQHKAATLVRGANAGFFVEDFTEIISDLKLVKQRRVTAKETLFKWKTHTLDWFRGRNYRVTGPENRELLLALTPWLLWFFEHFEQQPTPEPTRNFHFSSLSSYNSPQQALYSPQARYGEQANYYQRFNHAQTAATHASFLHYRPPSRGHQY